LNICYRNRGAKKPSRRSSQEFFSTCIEKIPDKEKKYLFSERKGLKEK